MSPAPWTYPSHSCFFTGQWPFRLNSQWKFNLDTPVPTLAEYLSSRGYQTAGFVANTNCCSYETGLNRGFAHFADYALTPRSILTRTVRREMDSRASRLSVCTFYEKKWATLQSRGAGAITDDFLRLAGPAAARSAFLRVPQLLRRPRALRPPARILEVASEFHPRPRATYQFLVDYVGIANDDTPDRDLVMARDCYDDCIAALDAQLGRLLRFVASARVFSKIPT